MTSENFKCLCDEKFLNEFIMLPIRKEFLESYIRVIENIIIIEDSDQYYVKERLIKLGYAEKERFERLEAKTP